MQKNIKKKYVYIIDASIPRFLENDASDGLLTKIVPASCNVVADSLCVGVLLVDD